MLMQEPQTVLLYLQVCRNHSLSAALAWRYLEAALAFGKELKVWSLQNDSLQCEYSFHQT